jgi:hypothetical protein
MRYLLGISLDALTMHPGSVLCTYAIRIILECTVVNLAYCLQEFLASKYEELILASSDVWSQYPAAVLDVTRLLVWLSNNKGFTVAMPWATPNKVFEIILRGPEPGAEAMENMTVCLFNYVSSSSEPMDVIDSLCTGSFVLYTFVTYKTRRVKFSEILASLVMYVVAFEIPSVIGRIGDLISTSVIERILGSFSSSAADPSTINNIFIMLEACIQDEVAAASIIEAGLIKFLYLNVVQSKALTKHNAETCAMMFFRITCQVPLRFMIVDTRHIDSFIEDLVKTEHEIVVYLICGKYSLNILLCVLTQVLCIYIGGLYNLSNGYLLEESDKLSFLSPRLVQAFAKEILASFKS